MQSAPRRDDPIELSGVPLADFHFDIAGRSWTLRAVRDQSALLAASSRFGAFPFGLLLWESAPVLAAALAEHRTVLSGKRVLELGAGTGLAGLVARFLGAAQVRQTDHSGEALALCRVNAALNGMSGLHPSRADWNDWRDEALYDLIIGSDVLYDAEAHTPLRAIFERNLAPGGRVLLTDPGRMDTPQFLDGLESAGWHVTRERRCVAVLQPAQPNESVEITLIDARPPDRP